MAQRSPPMLLIEPLQIVNLPGRGAEKLGILIAGGKIVAFVEKAEVDALKALPELGIVPLEGTGLLALPGLVDMHVHITGGGGEAGPFSRTPEARLSELLDAGVTTVVGVIGTDSVSRSQENLVAKCQALNAEGITSYHWCGGYRYPVQTATGDVQRDLLLLQSCVGVGEVAVSDHRGSLATPQELARLASDCRVGGMIGGKAGLLYCHMGDGTQGLQPLRDALALGSIPITQILPTHMSRNQQLIDAGEKWVGDGGWVDVTAEDNGEQALIQYRKNHVPLSRCTVSSDSYGSLPVFDDHGKLVSYEVGHPSSLLRLFRKLVLERNLPINLVAKFFTLNPSNILKLHHKGRIQEGADADILLLDQSSLELKYVIAKGAIVRTPHWVRGGLFERGPRIRPIQPI